MTGYGLTRHKQNKKTRRQYHEDFSDNDSYSEDQVDNAQSTLRHHPEINHLSYPTISDDSYSDEENESCQSSIDNVSKTSSTNNFNNTNQNNFVLLAIIVIVAVIAIICYRLYDYEQNRNIYDERKFYNDIDGLGKKYKVNDNSILQIQTVISTTFQKEDTASFIFTYNSKSSRFNPESFNEFINDVAIAAARFLRNKSDIKNHVIVESTKLDMQYHSELIERYRNDVTKYGVMLVKDLDEVPSSLAMAFHYYCDEFNPLVKRSAIFFTLNMARCSDHKTTHASVEKCLAKKWTIIPKDNIVPLLTRIVNVVIDVTNVI